MPTIHQIGFVIFYTALAAPDFPGSLIVVVCALTPLIEHSLRWKIMAGVVAAMVCVTMMTSRLVSSSSPLALGILLALVPIIAAAVARWTFLTTRSRPGAAAAALLAALIAHAALATLASRLLEIQIDGL